MGALSTTTTEYNAVAKWIHWLTALAIVALLGIGWIMTDLPNTDSLKFPLFQWHKSLGITVLLLSVLRILWRLTHAAPALPSAMAKWEKALAHAVYGLFYLLVIAMPMSGWAVVSTSRITIPTRLFGFIPWPSLPVLPTLADKNDIHEAVAEAHETLAFIVAALLVLHVGAALKHHFIMRDDTLTRMAPKCLSGFLNRFGGTGMSAVLALAASLAFAAPAHARGWTIDYQNSSLGFDAVQNLDKFHGSFGKFTLTVDLDPDHPEGGRIDARIDTGSATAGSADRDSYLPQSDWFDTQRFPQAEFMSNHIERAARIQPSPDCSGPQDKAFIADGRLTLKGIARPVTLDFCLKPEGDHFRATGAATVVRTDFHVGIGQWADEGFIKHDVIVGVDIVARPG